MLAGVPINPIVKKDKFLKGSGVDDGQLMLEYQKLKDRVETTYTNCQTGQQKRDLIMCLSTLLDTYTPIATDDIHLPAAVKTKGRPKQAIHSRLPSYFELVDKESQNEEKAEKLHNTETHKDCDQKRKTKKKAVVCEDVDNVEGKRCHDTVPEQRYYLLLNTLANTFDY